MAKNKHHTHTSRKKTKENCFVSFNCSHREKKLSTKQSQINDPIQNQDNKVHEDML